MKKHFMSFLKISPYEVNIKNVHGGNDANPGNSQCGRGVPRTQGTTSFVVGSWKWAYPAWKELAQFAHTQLEKYTG